MVTLILHVQQLRNRFSIILEIWTVYINMSVMNYSAFGSYHSVPDCIIVKYLSSVTIPIDVFTCRSADIMALLSRSSVATGALDTTSSVSEPIFIYKVN
jgi:hypothetical protein